MRLSVEKDDKGHNPDLLSIADKVYVDGIPIAAAVTADTEQGFVKCLKLNTEKPGELETEIIRGKVVLTWKPGFEQIKAHYGIVEP